MIDVIKHIESPNYGEGENWWWNEGATPKPSPIHTFIVKIASRCNLDCTYCYMYKYADQRWRLQPKFIEDTTIVQLARRINEYATLKSLSKIYIVFHGGEPLLVGPEKLQNIYRSFKDEIHNSIDVFFSVQTNGLLLTKEFVDLFKKTNTSIGLSVDGPPQPNKDMRLLHNGESSSFLVEDALNFLLNEANEVFDGVLCVMNLNNDPIENFKYFKSKKLKSVNYLFPDANYDTLPPGVTSFEASVKYTDWLEPIFNIWYNDADEDQPDITLFNSIIRTLLGEKSLIDSIGSDSNNLIVIETNGEIEGLDSLKTTYNKAAFTGLNIFDNCIEDTSESACVLAGDAGIDGLCYTCQKCLFVDICKGGYQPNRFSKDSGFLNPSIYCLALQRLIYIIAKRMSNDFINSSLPLPILIKKVLTT